MATQEPESTPRRAPWLLRPWTVAAVGWASFLVTTAALLYSVYWRDHPELTYLVATTRARIVVAGQVSALHVFYGQGESIRTITTDVTAAQVALWNNGRQAVESSDVLDPLRFVTEPSVRILEVRWARRARKVCRLDIDDPLATPTTDDGPMYFLSGQSPAARGELPIRFRILEPQDGGVLQIIYAGPSEVSIRLAGTFKGQPEVRAPWQPTVHSTRGSLIMEAVFLLGFEALLVATLVKQWRFWRSKRTPDVLGGLRAALVITVLFSIPLLYFLFDAVRNALRMATPPFAF